MALYEAYGLIVDSERELPGFPEATGQPDVIFRQQALPSSLASLHNGGSQVAGRIEGGLRFVAENGNDVVFEPEPDAVPAVVQAYLAHFVLSVVLRQRGYLVLHASALVRGPHAIVFIGDSGWGKSTTAEFFLQHGFQLLAEDAAAIDLSGSYPELVPGPVQLKLRPQAGAWLREDFEELPRFHNESETRVRRSGFAYCAERRPLTRVYALSGEIASETGVAPLPPAEGVLQLIRHTRVATGFTAPDFAARHLRQCERVVQKVPVKRLERKWGLDELPHILRVVEDDLASEAEPSAADASVVASGEPTEGSFSSAR